MFRFNMILLAIIVICALALVTTQNKARHYYSELEKEKKSSQELETEYGRLLLEESTWMMSARIEELSIHHLRMIKPEKEQTEIIVLEQQKDRQ